MYRPIVIWGLLLAGLLATQGATATQLTNAAPPAGRYEGRLCVTTRNAAPDCGPARVDARRGGRVNVRIGDLLYSLTLESAPAPGVAGNQLDVVLKHGAMQIDGFTAPYEWKNSVLHFVDVDKSVRYEVQWGKRLP